MGVFQHLRLIPRAEQGSSRNHSSTLTGEHSLSLPLAPTNLGQAILPKPLLFPHRSCNAKNLPLDAALMESFAQSQAFMDGNKRVVFLLTDIMLRANGWFLDVEPDAAHAFIAGFATHKVDRFSRIVAWIKSFAKRIAD
ncbi:MAG TPA: Fic family protein [Candidatus Solibacter sp.]|nr:Fic family protein [Candidatus Solibacter sp.]